MSLRGWVAIVAAVGALVLATFAIVDGRPNPLKTPFARLCLNVAAWTGASPAFTAHRVLALGIDRSLSPLTAPLALDFVLTFVGTSRALHRVRVVAFVLGGSLSLASVVALLVGDWRPALDAAWQIGLVGTAVPIMTVAVALLAAHHRRTVHAEERARASFLLLALGVATTMGLTDSIGSFVVSCPGLSELGILLAAAGMAVVTFRFRLFGRPGSHRILLILGLAAAAGLYASAVALSLAATRPVAIILVLVAVVLAAVATARERMAAAAIHLERTERLATLGRFAAQMDHDVRNPLAALKGAAQLLRRDLGRIQPLINRLEFAELIIDQVGRIETIFQRYRRMSRLELDRTIVQVNDIVRAVLARQMPSLPKGVTVDSDLAHDAPACLADADLLATIVENLTCNAVEAMPNGGTLTVATRATRPRAGVELALADTGIGMDARTREQATDDFFTTKPNGNGLGLAFTHRVAKAHGGELIIASQLGTGTQVRLWIPAHAIQEQERHAPP